VCGLSEKGLQQQCSIWRNKIKVKAQIRTESRIAVDSETEDKGNRGRGTNSFLLLDAEFEKIKFNVRPGHGNQDKLSAIEGKGNGRTELSPRNS
jgi:hypothetical protein